MEQTIAGISSLGVAGKFDTVSWGDGFFCGGEMLRGSAINIPSEILRTIVTIDALGSFSRAAGELGMNQSSISMQVKKLSAMVGGAVFDLAANGARATPLGELVLAQAKQFLSANDQILALGGVVQKEQPLRLGLPSLLVKEFLEAWQHVGGEQEVSVTAGYTTGVLAAFTEGALDVVCLTGSPAESSTSVCRWLEELAWVGARDFVLPIGKAVPIVAMPGSTSDNPMIGALERASLSYRVTFKSSDKDARYAAVSARYGITVIPARFVPDHLSVLNDDRLPSLPAVPVAVFVSPDCDADRAALLVETLRGLAPHP